MANRTKSVLKGYFETGDTPSQAQYADLIDSQLNIAETQAQEIVGPISFLSTKGILAVHVTASGNISSSGHISASEAHIAGKILAEAATFTTVDTGQGANELFDMNQNVLTTSNVQFNNITGSNISASSTISAFGSSSLTGLPTSKPTITGSLWLSGSADDGTSKYLLVFTG